MSDKRFNNNNLKTAISNSGMTREQIAEKVGCDTSSITKYCNGDRYPKTDIIIKLAELFNCSTDYLLGVSDIATNDKDLKFVCDFTGLSENAVITLNMESENFKIYNTNNVDDIISNDEKVEVISMLLCNKFCENYRDFKLEFGELFNDVLIAKEELEEEIAKLKCVQNKFEAIGIQLEYFTEYTQKEKNIYGMLFSLQQTFIDFVKNSCKFKDYENAKTEYFSILDNFSRSTE